ncbi:MAG: hypothetical protein HZA52_13970 [Planctomycetes bacterium]|nr:hypothetical protein [Planctomycetota bacterium]
MSEEVGQTSAERPRPTAVGRRGKLFTLALALGSIAALAFVLEIGARIRARLAGTPWDSAAARRELTIALASFDAGVPDDSTREAAGQPPETAGDARETSADAREAEGNERATGGLVDAHQALHPYLGFDDLRMHERLRAAIEASRSPDGFDVLVEGGSVAADFVGAGSERLIELLRAAPGFPGGASGPVRVWCEARAEFKQPQQANALACALAAGLEPELVITIDGFDDVAIALSNVAAGTHPLYPSAARWNVLAGNPTGDVRTLDRSIELRRRRARVAAFAERALARHVELSALAGSLALGKLRELRAEADAARAELDAAFKAFREGAAERGPQFTGSTDDALRCAIEAWSEGAISMWSLCRARGIPYLHVLQPTLHDEGAKPPSEDELALGASAALGPDEARDAGGARDARGALGAEDPRGAGDVRGPRVALGAEDALRVDAARRGYPALRAKATELAGRGLPFCDASRVFADVRETLYRDASRFDDAGHRLLAETIARRALEELAARAR